MIILSTISNNKVWGTNRLYEYSGDKNIKTIGSVYSVSGIEELRTKIIYGDDYEDLYLAIKNNPKKYGLPEGVDYPVIISFTAGDSDLSIQVHPTDEYAKNNENKLIGKSESWYFIEEPKQGWIYAEAKLDNKPAIRDKILSGEYEKVVDKIGITKGDIVYIPSGTLHALTKGSLVYEIQQSTDITYRFYDYARLDDKGQKRELHLDDAISTLDTSNKVKIEKLKDDRVVESKPYSLLKTKLKDYYTNSTTIAQAITVLSGNLIIEDFTISKGMSILVLPGETIKIQKSANEVMIATPKLYFME
ncbi:MAG: class I mannose-6-phosphate isomerase [Helcococcus sp.]|nr:class I mannose-6-phosphate isomerase [Helcococcus sp.]